MRTATHHLRIFIEIYNAWIGNPEALALIDAAASAELGEFTLETPWDFPTRKAAAMMASMMVGME
jgi:hypothetical protein